VPKVRPDDGRNKQTGGIEMIEWFLFLATLVLPLLVARCIAAMGSEDSADHDVWRRMCVKEEGHEWD